MHRIITYQLLFHLHGNGLLHYHLNGHGNYHQNNYQIHYLWGSVCQGFLLDLGGTGRVHGIH